MMMSDDGDGDCDDMGVLAIYWFDGESTNFKHWKWRLFVNNNIERINPGDNDSYDDRSYSRGNGSGGDGCNEIEIHGKAIYILRC